MPGDWNASRHAPETQARGVDSVLADMSGNEVRARDNVVHLASIKPCSLEQLVNRQPLQATPPLTPRMTKARPRRASLSERPKVMPPTPPLSCSTRPPPAFRSCLNSRRLKQCAKENDGSFHPKKPSKMPPSKLQRSEARLTRTCVPDHPMSHQRSKSAPVLRCKDIVPGEPRHCLAHDM